MPRRPIRPPQPTQPDHTPLVEVQTLLAEAQALSARLAALNEITISVQEELDIDTLMQAVARHSRWVIDFQLCTVAWYQADGYTIQALRGTSVGPDRYPPDAGAIGRVLGQQYAALIHTATAIDALPPGMQSAMIVPLRSGGQLLGTLNFYSPLPTHYRLDDLRVATALAMNVAALLHNIRLFREVARTRSEIVTTLDSISDAVLVIDRPGHVRIVNQAAARLLELNIAQTIGQPLVDLAVHASAPENPSVRFLRAQIVQIWRAGTEQHGTFALPDGQHLEWTLATLIDSREVDGVVLTLRNISDTVALETLRDDFIHMLVHDLRTPLTSLLLSFDLIQEAQDDADHATVTRMLRMARKSATTLLNQVSTLLDVRKIEAGQLVLNRTETDLVTVIAQAFATVRVIAQGQHQRLELLPVCADTIIAVDRALIQRVFENLLSNALKFTPPGGQVSVELAWVGATIECSVLDEGPGVPAAVRAMIFEKYRQLETAPRQHSTGLGLAFCKLVVERHGGVIGVEDAPGGGSRFWLRLPQGSGSAR